MTLHNLEHRVDVFGCPLDLMSLNQAVDRITLAIRDRRRITHAALNTAKLINMRQNQELYYDVNSADFVTADGMGILIAARLAGHPVSERVTGIDLMERILNVCAKDGYRPYFLGARQEVLDAAVSRIQTAYPQLRLAGARNGYFRESDEAKIVADINAARADCVFVGVPTPMKERFIARNRADLNASFVMGVGGSIDVLAKHVQRAPEWMQRHGLEWFYRVLQEPRRMWKRYLVTNTKFLGWICVGAWCRVRGRPILPLAEPVTVRFR